MLLADRPLDVSRLLHALTVAGRHGSSTTGGSRHSNWTPATNSNQQANNDVQLTEHAVMRNMQRISVCLLSYHALSVVRHTAAIMLSISVFLPQLIELFVG